jgi:hypothetical protein
VAWCARGATDLAEAAHGEWGAAVPSHIAVGGVPGGGGDMGASGELCRLQGAACRLRAGLGRAGAEPEPADGAY